MSNVDYHLVGSVLVVNGSGVNSLVSSDLQLPEGKSIANLLDDQEKEKNNKIETKEQ